MEGESALAPLGKRTFYSRGFSPVYWGLFPCGWAFSSPYGEGGGGHLVFPFGGSFSLFGGLFSPYVEIFLGLSHIHKFMQASMLNCIVANISPWGKLREIACET